MKTLRLALFFLTLFLVISCQNEDLSTLQLPTKTYSEGGSISFRSGSQQIVLPQGFNSNLFNLDLLDPTLADLSTMPGIVDTVDNFMLENNVNFDDTGYPAWGAIQEVSGFYILPLLRPKRNFSNEMFFFKKLPDNSPRMINWINALDSEEPYELIASLTTAVQTEEAFDNMYARSTLTNIVIPPGSNPEAILVCNTIYASHLNCLKLESDILDEPLCCKCEEVTEPVGVNCSQIGGSGGAGGGSGGGSGGGGFVGGGRNPGTLGGSLLDDYIANFAPDTISQEINCTLFPCVCNAVSRFLVNPDMFSYNLSSDVSKLIHDVFDINNNVSLHITTSYDLNSNTNQNDDVDLAQTDVAVTQLSRAGVSHVTATVVMNSDYIRGMQCTEAHIGSTLIHESIHAYIFSQESALSPNFFNTIYPLYSGTYDKNNSHHVIMANDFISYMSSNLRELYPNISQEYAEALSWHGLEGQKVYQDLPNSKKNEIQQLIDNATCQNQDLTSSDLAAQGLMPCQ